MIGLFLHSTTSKKARRGRGEGVAKAFLTSFEEIAQVGTSLPVFRGSGRARDPSKRPTGQAVPRLEGPMHSVDR